MKALTTLATACLAVLLACAPAQMWNRAQTLRAEPTPVRVRSNSRSDVDVYLLCGDRDARWLGAVLATGSGEFAIDPAQRRCARGLNFFLVRRDLNRGYWVGPLFPEPGSRVDLVIERYVGLSAARVRPAAW